MEEPEWVALGEDKNGITINQYFITHPEMVLGTMAEVSGPYGMETACLPLEGADLAEQLEDAAAKIHGTMVPAVTAETELDEIMESIPADPSVRNYSFTVVDDQIYYRVNSLMNPVKLPAATAERVKGMVEIREVVRDLIALQMEENATDEAIRELQVKLNQVYDVYTGKYGVIGSNANKRAFSDDSSYCLLCSLEDLNEDGTLKRKADMFTKRTIKKAVAVTSVETAAEALTISLNEKARVDLPYMAGLTGKTEEKVAEELTGVIFRDPVNGQWETADEYLSGNVREKLKTAKIFAENHPELWGLSMKILYLIGGTMGVGKTTVSQQLKRDLNNSVFLDGDWCWDASPFQVTDETKAMVIRNICFLLNSFIHCSAYENVIFCWVMHEQSIIDSIINELDTENCIVKKISLTVDEINLQNRLKADAARKIRTTDIIDRSIAEIPMYQALDTIKIETSNKTIREIVDKIMAI